MYNIRLILAWVSIAFIAFAVFYPLFHWAYNPELTQMELLKMFWHYYLISFALGIIVRLLGKRL